MNTQILDKKSGGLKKKLCMLGGATAPARHPLVPPLSFSIYINKQSLRNPSSILFRSLVLTSFIAENARSDVAVETGKVRTRRINLFIQMKTS